MKKTIGVLALEETFREHCQILESLHCKCIKVQRREDLEGIHGLIISGGECKSISNLLTEGLGDSIKALALQDFPIFGISAGMTLLSKSDQTNDEYRLGLMDMTVCRKALVRELETNLLIPALGTDLVKVIFIDAPNIQEIAPNVGILAEYNGKIVFVRQGNMLASAFHPERTSDDCVYRYFLDIVNEKI